MTFLEFCFRRYVGPPESGRYWRCPWCERRNASVVVNDPAPGHAVKYRCVAAGCDSGTGRGFGDEFDLLRHFHPGCRYPDLLAVARGLRVEYEQDAATPLVPMGTRRHERDRRGAVALAWDLCMQDLDRSGQDHDAVYGRAVEALDEGRLSPRLADVVEYWVRFRGWCERMDAEHLRACDVPECDAVVCRLHRGLDPLTPEELEVERPAAEMRRRQRNGRARR